MISADEASAPFQNNTFRIYFLEWTILMMIMGIGFGKKYQEKNSFVTDG